MPPASVSSVPLLPAGRLCAGLLGLSMLAACSSTNPGRTWSGTLTPRDPSEAPAVQTAVDEESADDAAVQAEVMMVRAQVYEAMSTMSRAQAAGDVAGVETALDQAMDDMRRLAATPGALDDAEMRELYRSVITAYEQYYGVSDTLRTAYGDIFAFRDEMFSAMNRLREPLLEDVMLPDLQPAAMTIPLHRNRLVEQSIQYLLQAPEKHLYRWMSRSATYFPMIEQVLREEGVPDELKYLALIESGLNPRARSHAGAVGMWQFMSATGRAYGLKIDHWVDERRDPEKATRAAARHLRDLYATFGNWHFALAAYNSGAGRVQRAVRRAAAGPEATIWDLYPHLPRETRNYIPMYMAAVMVVSSPGAFQVQSVRPGPRYTFDVVSVEGMTDLRAVAEMAGTDVETVRALNPEVLQWTTPPSKTPYRLRLPSGAAPRFRQAYTALPEAQKQTVATHTVRGGDSLSKIARRYATTVAALQEMNGLRGTTIRAGQTLHIPVPYEAYDGAAADDGAASRTQTPVVAAAMTVPAPATGDTRVRYRVRRGDNLTTIARKYAVDPGDLRAWNDLHTDRIDAGQVLTIYPGGTAPTTARAITHKVRRGDNLTTIARKYGVTVADLRTWNDLRTDRLRVGQRLTVEAGAKTTGAKTTGAWISYKVRRGDNLTTIARKYGVTVADLRTWNDLRTNRLRIGQRLAVYRR